MRVLPQVPSRVETGPTRFGDDWPGVFIRGDDAAAMADLLKSEDWREAQMPMLIALLESCRVK